MFIVQEWIKNKWHGVQAFMDRADAEDYMKRLGGTMRIKKF